MRKGKRTKATKISNPLPSSANTQAFCPACGEARTRGQQGFCLKCLDPLQEALQQGKQTIVYCRVCKTFQDLDAHKHGHHTLREASRTVTGKITLVLFSDEEGCPDCFPKGTPDQPHAIIVRTPLSVPPEDNVA